MTREQAKREIDDIDFYLQHHTDDYSERSHDAMMMAIKALSQEPCDDAISRQAVLDGLKGCMCEDWVKTLFATMVKQLPSVTPSRHKGHWLRLTTVNPKEFCNRCSECGYEQFYAERYKYCPNCGAKMVEPQESEDKGWHIKKQRR